MQVSHLYLNFFPFVDLLQSPFFHSVSVWAVLGEWTGTTEFHSNSGLLLWSRSSLSPFSGASISSKQLSLQPVPSPNHNRPITGQLCVWIWAALLNSSVCQYRSLALCLSFSFCHSFSFCFSLWLIQLFLPVQPTSFNMHPLAIPKYHFNPPPPAFCFLLKNEPLSTIVPTYN